MTRLLVVHSRGASRWQRLVAAVLVTVGRLRRRETADAADRNPSGPAPTGPGVTNSEALRLLFPAHLRCDLRRQARPVTERLHAELARAMTGQATTPAERRRSAALAG